MSPGRRSRWMGGSPTREAGSPRVRFKNAATKGGIVQSFGPIRTVLGQTESGEFAEVDAASTGPMGRVGQGAAGQSLHEHAAFGRDAAEGTARWFGHVTESDDGHVISVGLRWYRRLSEAKAGDPEKIEQTWNL
jgi:hypothetical protein